MSALILDTETTGLAKCEVIELGYMGPLERPGDNAETTVMRFRPACAIELGAMAKHHIIDADLAECPPWTGWGPHAGVEYLVGHNVDFDWKAIGSPPHVKRICTLALARARWPNLDSHSLAALTYFLNPPSLARTMLKDHHGAGPDVVLCFRLLMYLVDGLRSAEVTHATDLTWERLWQISEKARIPTTMPFGKYGPKNGQPGIAIATIRRLDPGYVDWLVRQPDVDPYLVKALRA